MRDEARTAGFTKDGTGKNRTGKDGIPQDNPAVEESHGGATRQERTESTVGTRDDNMPATAPDGRTIGEITEKFNEILRRREERDGPCGAREYAQILTEATPGRWSVEYSRESDRQRGLGELIRRMIELGEPPMMRIRARLNIETLEGAVGRQGSADGRERDERTQQEMEQRALANAISTLRKMG